MGKRVFIRSFMNSEVVAKTMKRNNMVFHTLDPDVAIDDLIEIHLQRKKR